MSSRRAGFNADRRGISIPSAIGASLIATVLFLVSFEGLSYVGRLMGLDELRLGTIGLGDASWLVPVALDALIVVATLLAIIRRAQRRKAELEWAIVYLATVASSAANFASHMQRDQGWLAALVATSAPVFLLLLSHAIIRTLIESESPAPKPKRTPATVAAAPADAPVAEAHHRASIAAKPRAPRATVGTVRATDYPFDYVLALSGDELLQEFDRLVAHPDTNLRGTPESPRFSAVAWRLVDEHNYRMSDLARRAGHADAARIKDRVRRVREHAPVAA